MFSDASVVGDWSALCERVERNGCLATWACREPVLARFQAVGELVQATAHGRDQQRGDAVLGALVRLASLRGGGEDDALLLVLHLLSPGITAAARRIAHLNAEPLSTLVGELVVRIRAFGAPGPRGGGRRERAFAANVLRDAEHAVRRELQVGRFGREVLIDPTDPATNCVLHCGQHEFAADGATELSELLTWASRTGVATGRDLTALLDGEASRTRGAAAPRQSQVAAGLRMSPATLRRRRDRALAALQTAAPVYLRHVGC